MESATQPITAENFWTHEYTRSLNVRGKTALMYLMTHPLAQKQVILEDMSLLCDLDRSECKDWIEIFQDASVINPGLEWA